MIKFGKKINMYVWGAIIVAILAGLYYLKTREGFQDPPPSMGALGALGSMPSSMPTMPSTPTMPPMPPMDSTPPMTTPTAGQAAKPMNSKPTPAEVRSKANELMALVNKM
jgi:hypothetical protein